MDLYPLWNSVRIAFISVVLDFFLGIFAAYYISKSNKIVKGILDVILTLPLVLPPTVVGYLLLRVLGPRRIIGKFFIDLFSVNLTMNWWSAIFATMVVIFPLLYRTFRASFENYDENLSEAALVLNTSNFKNFWCIRIPNCKEGIVAGLVLAFARGLGEYGATSMIAGYIPGKTATISTTVYQLWRTDNDALAFRWVLFNILLSSIVLLTINFLDHRNKRTKYEKSKN